MGWSLFGIIWGLAIGGVIFKLFFTGKYDIISALIYVAMGWIIIIAIKPMNENLPSDGLYWLLGGRYIIYDRCGFLSAKQDAL